MSRSLLWIQISRERWEERIMIIMCLSHPIATQYISRNSTTDCQKSASTALSLARSVEHDKSLINGARTTRVESQLGATCSGCIGNVRCEPPAIIVNIIRNEYCTL